MKAKIYIGAKKYALYIGRKIVQKTLEFLSLPARFVSNKIQELNNLTMWGNSIQNGIPTPTVPVEIESVGEKTKNLASGKFYACKVTSNKAHEPVELNDTLWVTDGIMRGVFKIIPVEVGKTYIASMKNTDMLPLYKISQYPSIESMSDVSNCLSYSNTIVKGAKYALVGFWQYPTPSAGQTVVIEDFQIEEGSTPTPYEPYGYKVPVEIATKGQNIFNKDKALISYTINAQGVIEPNDNFNCSNYVPVEVGKTYIRLNNTTPVGVAYHLFNADKVWLGSKTASTTGLMVIDNPNCKYVVVALSKQYSLNTYQIIEGTTPKPYEPYQYTTTNIYLNEPLRKIGDYVDTMSVDGTNVTVVRNVGNKIFNGTENYWTIASSGGNNYFSFLKTDIGTNSTILPTGSKDAISSRFDNSYGRVDLKFSVGGNYINFVYDALNYDIPTWTNWLSNNNIEFIYPHSNPTTETYTIEQPIQMPQDTLTIDTNTNIKPTKINITGDINNE